MMDRETYRYQNEVAADIAVLVPPDARTVLDVGCGDGFVSQRLPSWCQAIGVDRSLESLRRSGGSRSVGTITGLPFRDGSFDLVMVNDVLEHLGCEDRILAVQEIARVARRYVIVTVPLFEDLNVGATRCGDCRRFYHVDGHIVSFGLHEQDRLLDRFGFHCAAQVLSGDVWAAQPRAIMYLRRLLAVEYAFTDKPKCPFCGGTKLAPPREHSEWGKILDGVTCAQGLEDPTVGQSSSLRTESIGLYKIEGAFSEAFPSGFLDEQGRPVPLTAESVSISTIYFDRPDIYRTSTFSTFGPIPYFHAEEIEKRGVKILAGQAAWAGFFVKPPKREFLQVEIKGEAEGNAILTVWAYDTFKTYHSPVSTSVNSEFCVILTLRAAELSRFGLLFQLNAQGEALVLHSMRLLNAQDREAVRYDNRLGKARFFRLPGDGQCLLSLPFYGPFIPELTWMRATGSLQDSPGGISWPYGLLLPIGDLWRVCRILITNRITLRRLYERSVGRRFVWAKERVKKLLRHGHGDGLWKKSS